MNKATDANLIFFPFLVLARKGECNVIVCVVGVVVIPSVKNDGKFFFVELVNFC